MNEEMIKSILQAKTPMDKLITQIDIAIKYANNEGAETTYHLLQDIRDIAITITEK